MMLATPLTSTAFSTLRRFRTGKVRDVYDLGDALLIVATDRISAFDYVLGSGIPDKGKVLTQLSVFWFGRLAGVVPNHFVTMDVAKFPAAAQAYAGDLAGRAMLVRKTAPIEIECVARGYLSGSGWKEYQQTGRVCGIALPGGLVESDRLPEPIFTPATKASTGHDINISEADAAAELGDPALVARLRSLTLELYRRAAAHAESCGILLADTKFEFGLTEQGGLLLIDEALTPDSSRFWPADQLQARRPATELRQAVRPRLPRSHQVEQAAAGAVAAARCGGADPREVHRGLRAPDGRLARRVARSPEPVAWSLEL